MGHVSLTSIRHLYTANYLAANLLTSMSRKNLSDHLPDFEIDTPVLTWLGLTFPQSNQPLFHPIVILRLET